MKILLMTSSMMMGGVEKNIVRLTSEFSARGHSVVVLSKGGDLESEVWLSGGVHIKINITVSCWYSAIKQIIAVIKKETPDIIHVFSATAAFLLWLATKYYVFSLTTKKPNIVSSIMGIKNSPNEALIVTFIRIYLTVLGARKILIISPEIGRHVGKFLFFKKRLIEKAVVGIEIIDRPEESELELLRERLGIKKNHKIVITIGRLNPSKSHELFIYAAARVLEKRKDVQFLIIGEGETRTFLENEINRLGLNSFVHLIGLRKDVNNFIALSDVCVRPGIVEGFVGITVMEAQVLEVPVIAFETIDVRLVIEDGVTGILVPKSDTEKLAESIELLLDNEQLAKKIAAAGRSFIQSNYSISSVAEGLLSVYDQVISASDN